MMAMNGSPIEECARIEIEPGVQHNSIVRSSKKYQAVCSGVALTIFDASGTYAEDTIKADLEFDAELVAACWDLSEGCVVIADAGGTLHMVKPDGTVLFSKKIVAGNIVYHNHFIQFKC